MVSKQANEMETGCKRKYSTLYERKMQTNVTVTNKLELTGIYYEASFERLYRFSTYFGLSPKLCALQLSINTTYFQIAYSQIEQH